MSCAVLSVHLNHPTPPQPTPQHTPTHNLNQQSIREAFIPAVRNLCLTMKSRTMVQQDKAPYLNKLHDRLDYNEFITHNIVKAPWGAAAGSSGPKGGGAGVGGAARSAQHQQQTPAGARRSSVI